MKILVHNTAAKCLFKALSAAWAATLPLAAGAQPMSPEDIEEFVEYAQCIRANGYPEFPDPGPNGMQFRIAPGTVDQFQAAQRACTDQLPRGLAAISEPPTPERFEALLEFAECMRATGVPQFPDPNAQGVFQIGRGLDLRTPQAQQALQTCRESNPIAGLSISVGG